MDNEKNDKENINFHSKDIGQKEVSFNVKAKSTDKLRTSLDKTKSNLKSTSGKINNFPLLRGKNKFIILPIIGVIVVAAITIPILLNVTNPPKKELTPEEEEAAKAQITDEAIDLATSVDPNAPADTKTAVLANFDAKITNAPDDDMRIFLIQAKADVLEQYGMKKEAIATLESAVSLTLTSKNAEKACEIYNAIANLHLSMGNKDAAITAIKGAISAIESTAKDNEFGVMISGLDFYTQKLHDIEAS